MDQPASQTESTGRTIEGKPEVFWYVGRDRFTVPEKIAIELNVCFTLDISLLSHNEHLMKMFVLVISNFHLKPIDGRTQNPKPRYEQAAYAGTDLE